MLHRARVQTAKGPIDVVIQLLEGDDVELAPQESIAAGSGSHSFAPVATASAAPVSGQRIGRYVLGRRLGEGTFGVVFAARDGNLDREVAIKVLHADHVANAGIRRRFVEEAKAAARIDHPAIVTVFDAGVEDGYAYIAMELLRGESLSCRLARSGRLAPAAAMEIVRQIASALDAAHRAGVVHRDLKPDNIHFVSDPAVPGGERVKVLDFGLAKLGSEGPSAGERTSAKLVFGTPRYMSPEQTRSAALVDARSDIYSLGCILFELVCSVPPFDGEVLDVVRMHQQLRPPRARALEPRLSHDLEELIASMLAKSPDKRPQTMGAVQRALEAGGATRNTVAATMAPMTFSTTLRMARGTTPPLGESAIPAPPVALFPPAAQPVLLGHDAPQPSPNEVVEPAETAAPSRFGRHMLLAVAAAFMTVAGVAATLAVT